MAATMQACDRCHTRKTRCDRRIPQCGACEKAGTPCLHADKLRQRNLPRGYLDTMESMAQELKEENKRLRRLLNSSRNSQPTPAPAPTPQGADPSPDMLPPFAGAAAPASSPQISLPSEQAQTEATATNTPSTFGGSKVDDVFTLEVGYLSLIATGETRYLGSSSGMGLASIISRAISAQSGTSLSTDHGPSDDHSFRPVHIAPADAAFPSRAVAAPFIDAYFEHTHVSFPLLHRPSFMATVDRIYGEKGYYESYIYDAFLFDMVLAIGSSNFNRFEGAATAGASTYYAMAQSKVQAVMSMDGLSVLRAILLISQHGIFSSLSDTSASNWHLVGIGARLCFELGLHLEHRQLSGPKNFTESAGTISLEEEMRRRCFWCLYNLDRVVSFTLGRPVSIRDEEIDVPLPSPLDDEDLSPHRPIPVDVASSSSSSSSSTSPFLHIIRIRRISGQILSLFYNSRQGISSPIAKKRQIRRQFHDAIHSWYEDTKYLQLSSSSSSSSSSSQKAYVSSFLTPEWYTAVFNNAILLLYRPSPYMPHPTMVAKAHDDGEPDLMRLLKAAKASISSYSELHRKRRLNYSWITLHGAFIAGLAYIYSVGRVLRDPVQQGMVPDFLSIIEVTRACSNVLFAISERWNVSRRSCELFNKLSNAVIKDALNVATKQTAASGGRMQTQVQGSSAPLDLGGGSIADGGVQQPGVEPPPYAPSSLEEGMLGDVPHLDDTLVMDEFRQFFDIARQREGSFPSELVSGFSQDWPFDFPFPAEGEFDASMQDMGSTWEQGGFQI